MSKQFSNNEIETPHGVFTDNEYTQETAQQVYERWLADRENPKPQQPNKMEVLEQENKLLRAQVEALTAEGEFRDELIAEMAMLVYA